METIFPQFNKLIARIVKNVDAFLESGDISHLVDNELAWRELEILDLVEAATEFFTKVAMEEIEQAIACV